jgi:hypothetical protein
LIIAKKGGAVIAASAIRPRQQKEELQKEPARNRAQQRHRERTMSAKDILRKDGTANYLRCLAAYESLDWARLAQAC